LGEAQAEKKASSSEHSKVTVGLELEKTKSAVALLVKEAG